MNDDFEPMAGRTRTESAELRRRDLQRRSLPWGQRVAAFLFNRWIGILLSLMLLIVLMVSAKNP
jgi:hypothetical protein